MTRWFGHDTDGIVQDPFGNLVGSASYTAWTAETGGSQITNLVDGAGNPLDSGVIPVVDGRMLFGDPTDTILQVWLEQVGGDGTRQAINSRSIAQLVGGATVGTVTAVNGITPVGGNVTLDADDVGAISEADADAKYVETAQTIPTPVQRMPLTQMIWGGTGSSGFGSVGATGTVVEDMVDFVFGDRSWKLTTDGAGGQCAWGDYVLSAPVDLTDQIPVIALKFDSQVEMARVIDFKFYIGSSNFANIGHWNLLENAAAWPYVEPGQWVPISLPRGTFTTIGGTIDWANIDSVQLVVYDNSGGAVNVRLGFWGAMASPKVANPLGVSSICVDDGHSTALTKIAPYLDKYGMRATLYAIAGILQAPGSFPTYLTVAQTRVLQDLHGWAIGSHAYDVTLSNTGYTDYTSAQQLADMYAVRYYLNSLGFRDSDHLALPLGKYDTTVLNNANQVFRSVRHLTHVPGWESVPPANALKLRAVSPTSSTTLTQMQDWVDQAVTGGEWLIWVFHEIVDAAATGTQVLTADFQGIVDYIAAAGMAVKTVPEVIDAGARTAELTGALAGYEKVAGGNTHTAPNSLSQHASYAWPNDGSDSSTWPNRLEYKYFDTSTGTMRLGAYINEKSLARVRGTTPSDVPWRIMAHPSQTAAIGEVTLDDNTQKLWQWFVDHITSGVYLEVPWLQNSFGERLFFGSVDPNTYATPNLGDAWIDFGA